MFGMKHKRKLRGGFNSNLGRHAKLKKQLAKLSRQLGT
jgi:hypothetical protein